MKLKSLVLGSLFLQSAIASAALPIPQSSFILDVTQDRYQIGDVWGKEPVTPQTFAQFNPAFRAGAQATAFMGGPFGGGATAFYLGQFGGKHLVGTNYHVVKSVGCARLKFQYLAPTEQIIRCDHIIGQWSDVDFALVQINPTPEQEQLLAGKGLQIDWSADLGYGFDLLTFGYGTAYNPGQRNLMVNADNDCHAFSAANDFRFIPDPDQLNPSDYLTWSFAFGCDISHGDSGSALLDRRTGRFVGIAWTGVIPKNPRVRERAFLDSLRGNSPEVWTDLSYGVPARKIGEFLDQIVRGTTLRPDDVDAVRRFLSNNP